MELQRDPRLVLTLDAGGTKLAFSAMRGGQPLGETLELPAQGDDLEACLRQIRSGFAEIHRRTGREAVALSFAFPGPADYASGIIGDLGNLPAFRGGVPLGPMLEDAFGLPVFINNDGDLFALGEAMAGLLPEVNALLAAQGSPKRYRNLLGVTIGTGFGGGLVHDGRLFLGDNGAAAEIWLQRHRLERESFAEEGVSIRAVQRAYAAAAGLPHGMALEPKTIAAIARGDEPGDGAAAREAFRQLGEVAGDALANALTLVDGLAVIGGGLSGSAPLFLPALVAELNGSFQALDGGRVPRLELTAFNLEEEGERAAFLAGEVREIAVPGGSRTVLYDPSKRIGVGVSRLGTSRAVALGAYAFALEALAALDALEHGPL